jgi:formate hydrogenlyase subunit 3/multisubunit Na+/H+ antiporter MnhD subunit
VTPLLWGLGLLLLSGTCALACAGSARWATRLGAGGAALGCALGAFPALGVLVSGRAATLRVPWDVPYGAFFIEVDPLSAFFLLGVFVVSGVAAIYGAESLRHGHGPGETSDGPHKPLGPAWFFYNVLVAAMALVVVSRNGVLFLVAWEVMALASFFLVTFEDDDVSVRDAGRTYLVATHLGTAALLALFALLGREAGSLDFDRFRAIGPLPPSTAGALFLLGIVGFGGKAGLAPFHVWLPEAHPAAPTHVSAVMSGAMIKIGVYGLLRLLTFIGPPPLWWGWVLVAVGLSSGVLGALFALAQHDLKRLLAYSSVENVGIATTGIGIGVLGLAIGAPTVAVLGFAGALLHVANHALFKALLFLGAGAVAHGAGTREIDRLGGLLRRMPATGATFFIGALAICGLPPLNGFASEFLVYLGALHGGAARAVEASLPALAAAVGLALVGGLSVVAFAKAFGITFLGEPRTAPAAEARDPGLPMRLSLALLSCGCVAAGLAAPFLVGAMAPLVASAAGLPAHPVADGLAAAARSLTPVTVAGILTLALCAGLAILRRGLLSGRTVARSETWACGYSLPTPRMQYTGTSFVQPLTRLVRSALGTRRDVNLPAGLFPSDASFATRTPDVVTERAIRPAFAVAARGLARLRWLQHGRLNLYMLYVALTLVVLLVWKLG